MTSSDFTKAGTAANFLTPLRNRVALLAERGILVDLGRGCIILFRLDTFLTHRRVTRMSGRGETIVAVQVEQNLVFPSVLAVGTEENRLLPTGDDAVGLLEL